MARGVKKSAFIADTVIPSGSTFDFVTQTGSNLKITTENLLTALGVTGTISQVGDPLGTPVLDAVGTAFGIRNIETSGDTGLISSVSPQNGVSLSLDAQTTSGTGVPVLDFVNRIRKVRAGSGMAIAADGDDIVFSVLDAPINTRVIPINGLSDLPAPNANNEILLSGPNAYFWGNLFDVGINKFICENGVVVVGLSAITTGIISSATGNLFTAIDGAQIEISNLQIQSPTANIMSAQYTVGQTGYIYMHELIVGDCAGLFNGGNIDVIRIEQINVSNSSSNVAVFTGDNNVCNFDTELIEGWNGTVLALGSSTFNRFNATTVQLESNLPSNKIIEGLADSGNINAGGQGFVRDINIIGDFTSSANIQASDIRWNLGGNNKEPSSSNTGFAQLLNNIAPTILVSGIPTIIAGVWTPIIESRYTIDANGLFTFIGEVATNARIDVGFTLIKSGSGVDDFTVEFFDKDNNPTGIKTEFSTDNLRDVTGSITGLLPLVQGDKLQLRVTNAVTNNATVSNANSRVTDG